MVLELDAGTEVAPVPQRVLFHFYHCALFLVPRSNVADGCEIVLTPFYYVELPPHLAKRERGDTILIHVSIALIPPHARH